MDDIVTEKDFKKGDLVYLTTAGHDWIGRKSSNFNIPMSGRLARIENILSWKTKEGKEILQKRIESGLWKERDTLNNKFVLIIYLPEVSYEGKEGAAVPEVMPLYHSAIEDKKVPLFKPFSKNILVDMFKDHKKLNLVNK